MPLETENYKPLYPFKFLNKLRIHEAKTIPKKVNANTNKRVTTTTGIKIYNVKEFS